MYGKCDRALTLQFFFFATAPSTSIATDAYGNSAKANALNSANVNGDHGRSLHSRSTTTGLVTTGLGGGTSSYVALSREAYGAQDRTIPYRPADEAHAYRLLDGPSIIGIPRPPAYRPLDVPEEYGSSAYRPPQGMADCSINLTN